MGDRHLFIGNLCHVKIDELRVYCEKYGPLKDLSFNRDKDKNVYHCFAFVTYESSRCSTQFMSKRPHIIQNGQVFVKRALPRSLASIPERLVVTNRLVLIDSNQFERTKLRQYFQKFGPIRKFDFRNGFIDYDDYDPVDCVLLARPHFIEGKEIFVTKMIPTESDIKKQIEKKADQTPEGSTSSRITLIDEQDDLNEKYERLEQQFEQYKITKENEFSVLRLELERTKEELSDITQIKLDKLLKNQQFFQQQLWLHLFPDVESEYRQTNEVFLRSTPNKKRKTTTES